jgi:F-type H+-transporting ATPase subunit gamma
VASTQELRRKIKSIRSTAKLTKAMQMVAAAKMARATERAVASRRYAAELSAVIAQLAGSSALEHPLLTTPKEGRAACIVVTSNRGLAGALNSQVIRMAVASLSETTDLIVIGRKGQAYFRRFHPDRVVAEFPAADSLPAFQDATAIAHLVTTGFLEGRYSSVNVVYPQFESLLRQVPMTKTVLPILSDQAQAETKSSDFAFEPNPAQVLDTLLARSIPLRIFQMLVEASASEHSSRMLAMKSATDNANDIVDELTLTYQGVRQANITRQIIEIASGAAALSA